MNVDLRPPRARLRIQVKGLRESIGDVRAALFTGEAEFRSGSWAHRGRTVARAPETTLVIEEVPYGSYGIAAFQDLDGDGVLAKGPFGIPREPWGFSNDALGKFGPPPFSDFRVTVDEPEVELVIHLHQPKGALR